MSIQNQILELIQVILNSDDILDSEKCISLLNNFLPNKNDAYQILSEVIYNLKGIMIDMAQLVTEEVSLGNGSELLGDRDVLLYILKLNGVIQIFESYLSEIFKEEDEDILSPKMAIFSRAAINELKSIPDEEKEGFRVPIGYIKNGGAQLDIGVKVISTLGGGKKVLEYRNPRGEARVFAYKITGNLIYVVKMVLKKANWSKLLKKSINKKKPDYAYVLNLKGKLESDEGFDELRRISEEQLEEVFEIIGVDDLKSNDDISNVIFIINELLKINLSLDDFSGVGILNDVYERVYGFLEEYLNIEDVQLRGQKIIQIEVIMLEIIKDFLSSKSELTDCERNIINSKSVSYTNNSEINRGVLISMRRILCILNYFKDKNEELKKIEKQIILSR